MDGALSCRPRPGTFSFSAPIRCAGPGTASARKSGKSRRWDASQSDGDIQLFRAGRLCWAQACVSAETQKVPGWGRFTGRRGHSAFPRQSDVQGSSLCARGKAESPRLGRLAGRRGHSAFPRQSDVQGSSLCARGKAESPRLGTPRRAPGTFSFSAPVLCAGHRLVSARKSRKAPAYDGSFRTAPALALVTIRQ